MRPIIFSSLLIASAFTLNAQAGQKVSTMNVSAEMLEVCSLSSGDLNFGSGSFDDLLAAESTAQIIVNCSDSVNWTVSLDGGLHTGATKGGGHREMHHADGGTYGAGAFSYYVEYQTGGTPQNWGDGTSATQGDPVSGSGEAVLEARAHMVSGFLDHPNGGNTAGLYSDTITVTLDY